MSFLAIWFKALAIIMSLMTLLWIISVFIKNVSIVDFFWGLGFVITALFYYFISGNADLRSKLLLMMVSVWGVRLSVYLAWRNYGKGEDFRYREYRQKYGEHRYWWISFFQTFLLQGILMWLISAPLLGIMLGRNASLPGVLDYTGIAVWLTGFIFEAGSDFQLAKFRSDPGNKGKVLDTGFWKYTRHPNYFGDAAVWWGYGLICLSAGSYLPVLGSVLMTLLIIKVSGVTLLEKSLQLTKPHYADYANRTSSFLPWFPKKS